MLNPEFKININDVDRKELLRDLTMILNFVSAIELIAEMVNIAPGSPEIMEITRVCDSTLCKLIDRLEC